MVLIDALRAVTARGQGEKNVAPNVNERDKLCGTDKMVIPRTLAESKVAWLPGPRNPRFALFLVKKK